MTELNEVDTRTVRQWAAKHWEKPVGERGHLSVALTAAYNKHQRRHGRVYVNRNPSVNR